MQSDRKDGGPGEGGGQAASGREGAMVTCLGISLMTVIDLSLFST